MDRYEMSIKVNQLNKMVRSKDYALAAKIADKIEWKKVKQWSVMSDAIEAYMALGKNERARNVCVYAYNRSLGGKRLLSTLVELYTTLGEFDDAQEIYEEFVKEAPRDLARYSLYYRLRKAQKAPVDELIEILQEYKDIELDEKYEFELARLYSEAGYIDRCVRECDELILWFADGEYVEKALELKKQFVPLTPRQEEKLQYIKTHAVEEESYKKPEQESEQESEQKSEQESKEKSQEAAVTDDIGVEIREEIKQETKKTPEKREIQATQATQETQEIQQIRVRQTSSDETEFQERKLQKTEKVYSEQEDILAQTKRIDIDTTEDFLARKGKTDEEKSRKYVDDIGNTTQWTPIDEEVISVPIPDYSVYDTRNVQQELKANVEEIMQAYQKREEYEAILDLSENMNQEDPTKEIVINKRQWRKKSRNVVPAPVTEVITVYEKPQEAVHEIKPVRKEEKSEEIKPVRKEEKAEEIKSVQKEEKAEEIKPVQKEEKAEETKPVQKEEKAEEIKSVQKEEKTEEIKPVQKEEKAEETKSDKKEEKIEKVVHSIVYISDTEDDYFDDYEVEGQMDISEWLSQMEEQEMQEIPELEEDISEFEEDIIHVGDNEETKEESDAEAEHGAECEAEYEAAITTEFFDSEEIFFDEPKNFDKQEGIAEESATEDSDEFPDLETSISSGIEKMIKETSSGAYFEFNREQKANNYVLEAEEKKFLQKYLHMDQMEKRLRKFIGAKRMMEPADNSETGNVVIMGKRDVDKTAFAIDLFKALHVYDEDRNKIIAKISAESLNIRGMDTVKRMVNGETLIIENAGKLTGELIYQLEGYMCSHNSGAMIIITDEEFSINKLFTDHPEFAEMFTGRFILKQYEVNELVEYAKEYAAENNWKIEDKALLKLYLLLGKLKNSNQSEVLVRVEQLVEIAAAKAKSRFGNKIFGRSKSIITIKVTDFDIDFDKIDEDFDEFEEDFDEFEENEPDDEKSGIGDDSDGDGADNEGFDEDASTDEEAGYEESRYKETKDEKSGYKDSEYKELELEEPEYEELEYRDSEYEGLEYKELETEKLESEKSEFGESEDGDTDDEIVYDEDFDDDNDDNAKKEVKDYKDKPAGHKDKFSKYLEKLAKNLSKDDYDDEYDNEYDDEE